jgi:hypothetical protein
MALLRSRRGLVEGRYHGEQPSEAREGEATADLDDLPTAVGHPDRDRALHARVQLDHAAGA